MWYKCLPAALVEQGEKPGAEDQTVEMPSVPGRVTQGAGKTKSTMSYADPKSL